MNNQRSAGQTLINIAMKVEFVDLIDSHLEKMGFSDRSSFIRRAIYERLTQDGVRAIDEAVSLAPARTGKGGRPSHVSASAGAIAPKSPKVKEAAKKLALLPRKTK